MTAYLASHLVTLAMNAMSLITANAATIANPENRVRARNTDQGRYMAKAQDDRVDILKQAVMLLSSRPRAADTVPLVYLCMGGIGLVSRRMRREDREVLLVLLLEADR
jgi:hypothetical protein